MNVFHAQGRRLRCEHCGEAYSYLTVGTASGSTTGLPLISSSEKMAQVALKRALKRLAPVARKKKHGEARCIHCNRYQPWMASRSRLRRSVWGFILGVVVGFVAVIGAMMADVMPRGPNEDVFWIGLLVAGAVLGTIIGRVTALKDSPYEEIDNRSLKDPDLAELIAASRDGDSEPPILWCAALGMTPPEKHVIVSLGLLDTNGEMDFDVYSSDNAVGQLKG